MRIGEEILLNLAKLYLKLHTNKAILRNRLRLQRLSEYNFLGFYNNVLYKLEKYFSYFISVSVIYFILTFSFSLIVSGQTDTQCLEFYSFNHSLDSSWKNGPIQWQNDSEEYKSYPYALKSGEIQKGETSCINRSFKGPGRIAFWWKKSSYLNEYTDLYFIIDNTIRYVYNDYTFNWQKELYYIDAGTHEVSWAFRLRDYGSRQNPHRQVAGWIDSVEITESCLQSIVRVDSIHSNPQNYIYPTIQQGIDNVAEGGSVFVENGVYKESLIINKPLKLVGINNNTIIDLGNKAIDIMANNVTIQNFQIRNSDIAIRVFDSSDINIYNNTIANSNYGLTTASANKLRFRNNLVNARNSSIVLLNSADCIVENNTLLNNKEDAIKLKNSYNNRFSNNKFIYSTSCDIFAINCSRSNMFSECDQCPGQNNPDCRCCL